ncbi:hypothetical protein BKA70DRAFT_1271984 [Coprinopsis sp. MPI-PUGE-AT-0042]|nr:hypothetical protein BKA70DRAFT_1271984 [Coprinopsis sp. MPI-PUGE-AT-0042]
MLVRASQWQPTCFGPTPAIQSLILAIRSHADSWLTMLIDSQYSLRVYPFPTHSNLLCKAPVPLDARGFLTLRGETTEEAVWMLLSEGSLAGLSDQLIDHNERKGKDGKKRHWDKRRLGKTERPTVSRILFVVLLECLGSRRSGCSIPFHGLKRALDSPLTCSFRWN